MNMATAIVMPLSSLSEGESGEIIYMRGKPEVHRFLNGKGLRMGSKISVGNTAAIETSLTVRIGNMVSVIGKDIAQQIKVRLAN